MHDFLNSNVKGMHAYNSPRPDARVFLNTNENPWGIPDFVKESILESVSHHLQSIHRYPDRSYLDLRRKLADYVNDQLDGRRPVEAVTAANIWPANGSNEIFQILVNIFGANERSALLYSPSYLMHLRLAKIFGLTVISLDLDDSFHIDIDKTLLALETKQPDIIFLTSPNNPTGIAEDVDVICKICDVATGMVFVDEAYFEFSKKRSVIEFFQCYKNVVLIRTMSKAFASAGVRLGYAIAHPDVIDSMLSLGLPYHLSSISTTIAETILCHSKEILKNVDNIVEERCRMFRLFDERGVPYVLSDSNFILFGDFVDQKAIWKSFVKSGVLIRDVQVPGKLRVTVGTPEQNDAFFKALDELKE